ncbi:MULTISPECIES: SIR2 family protein [unclassified Pseudoalteromonas]|jgi:hypothetical protein|uniref:SIR2 family protein n=1 Tax=unclassified Pseudoalteromonas TaxID=194690 RepID=UPI0001EF8EFD|nr:MULTISPECIES: SIR2 family protein [unclassified Pseudoalteromonas]ADT69763.1 conserved hypothetical protein [Pseudoalteromonas sp. SM9913]
MAIEKIKQSADLIEKVEQYLQNGLNSNSLFNDALDEGDLLSIRSIKDTEHTHQYKASEVLYWVDRNAYLDEFDNWNGEQLRDKHREAIEYVDATQQDSVVSDLIALIKKKKVAPFVGAGVSAAAGYPSWDTVLKELGKKLTNVDNLQVEELLANERYLELAQLLADASSSQLNNHIRTTFRIKSTIEQDKTLVPDVIKLLPRLCAGAMVTTNFDTLIESWFKAHKTASEFDGILCGLQENHNFVTKLLKGERCLLKLHGDATQPESYIFTQTQYEQGYGSGGIDYRKQLPKALRQIYISHSLLFLGCSLQQDKTMELFEQVRNDGEFVIPEHFALLALPVKPIEQPPTVAENSGQVVPAFEADDDKRQEMEDRLFELGIRPIWYPATDNHKMLIQLIELMVDVADGRLMLRG